MTLPKVNGVRYLVAGQHIIPIYELKPGRWFDIGGTEYAQRDTENIFDKVDRCGLGEFSLDEDGPYTDACRPHEFMFTSTTFRTFHTQREANEWLDNLTKQIEKPGSHIVAFFFELAANTFGWITGHDWKKTESEQVNTPPD